MTVAAAPRRAWSAVLVWVAFQLALTSLPGTSLPQPGVPGLDLVVHFGLYGILGALVTRAATFAGLRRGWLAVAWTAIAALAATDEWHQRLIPGRTPALSDWVADATGAAVGLWVATLMMRSRLAAWLR